VRRCGKILKCEIDALVYQVYNLSHDEIMIVEGMCGNEKN
jgi:hypothetical protein